MVEGSWGRFWGFEGREEAGVGIVVGWDAMVFVGEVLGWCLVGW